jgi:alpha-1,2-mannosyltransferase
MTLPSYLVALHFAIRIALANRCPISDCDEIFNYWEPLHFLNNGVGLQTWEYAPTFALRTYIYLMPLTFMERLYQIISNIIPLGSVHHLSSMSSTRQIDGPYMFQLLRGTIAVGTAFCEIRLVSAIKKCYCQSTAYSTWCILLVSTGMFVAGPAFLPSATVMNCLMMSISDQLEHKFNNAILWGLISCLTTGWPFCAILFIPLAIQSILAKYKISCTDSIKLIVRVGVQAFVIQLLVMTIDFFYYGKVVSPTLNIFMYNTGLGKNEVNRDDLYGIEDSSYYIKNLLLNWNLVAFLGIIISPLIICCKFWTMRLHVWDKQVMIIILIPMFLWLVTVFPRPHKEERFLYPIYPMIAVSASYACDYVAKVVCLLTRSNTGRNKQKVVVLVLLSFSLISISRSMLLYKGYGTPMKLYNFLYQYIEENDPKDNMNTSNDPFLLCTGIEWFRFPSSYNLPGRIKLAFLPSPFSGQLPQYFSIYGSQDKSLTVQGKFNDINAIEMDRFVNISDCSFVIELVGDQDDEVDIDSKSVIESMKNDENEWQIVTDVPFLKSVTSPMPHRLIYIPYLHHGEYKHYTLFERKKSSPR